MSNKKNNTKITLSVIKRFGYAEPIIPMEKEREIGIVKIVRY